MNKIRIMGLLRWERRRLKNAVAMMGDEPITREELEATLKELPERKRDVFRLPVNLF